MILNGCSLKPRVHCLKYTTFNSNYADFATNSSVPVALKSRSILNSWKPNQKLDSVSSKGLRCVHLSASPSPLLKGNLCGFSVAISKKPVQRRTVFTPRAATKDVPTTFRFPAMTNKPRWWWRIFACLPYLLPLHEPCLYAVAETAYHLHPFLEDFEFMTYPFQKILGNLPPWFKIAYFLVAHLAIVRRKEWPHFFRYHVITGSLLHISLQVIAWVTLRWIPRAAYWGKVGMHFWTGYTFAFLFTVVECMRCALAGMYADIPFVSDAAYMQIPYD